jgi:transposase
MMQSNKIIVGVDVSKLTLDLHIQSLNKHRKIDNSAQGLKDMLAWFKSLNIQLGDVWLIMEYTGGYEYRLVQCCNGRNIACTRVAGLEIKKSLGMQRGKTDKVDAKRIAEYGFEKSHKLQVQPASCETAVRLKMLLTQRAGFINDRKSNEHRMKETMCMMDLKPGDSIVKNYKKAVDQTNKMIAAVEENLKACVKANPSYANNFSLLTSIPGIGPVNAWMVLADTENFTRFSDGRKYGAHCGIVPYKHQSGTSIQGKGRVSHMANKEMKAVLDMAARASAMHNPEIKEYYERRAALGKHHLSIMTAIKFKLVLTMFSIVKKQTEFVHKVKKTDKKLAAK